MTPFWLDQYTKNLDHNMKALFFHNRKKLQQTRTASIAKSNARTKALKDAIKRRADYKT